MKKFLVFVTIVAVVFGLVVMVLNMIPTRLKPEVSEYLRAVGAETVGLEQTPLPSPENQAQFLSTLSEAGESEKLQALQEFNQVVLQRLQRPFNILEIQNLLEALIKNMAWAKEQKWTLSGSTKLAVLKSEVREVVVQRHTVVMSAIETEMRTNLLAMKDLETTDGGVFFDGPAILNTYYERMSERKDNIGCIEDYNCVPLCGRGDCWPALYVEGGFLTNLRNPKGKEVLKSYADTDGRILRLEPLFQQLDGLTLVP